MNWMQSSHLKLNQDKTEVMLLGNATSADVTLMWPTCMGPMPPPKMEIKSLGVWLDADFSFRTQARKVAASCFGILRMLRKVLPLLPSHVKKLVVQALILSRLDYGNALYLGAPTGVISRLQTVQNCAARILTEIPARTSAKPALKLLHWLPMVERIQFKALCIAHRIIHKKAPEIIAHLVQPYQANRPLRSNDLHLACVPRIKRVRKGGRLFSYQTSKLWNSLPLTIRSESNYLSFRKLIKTWLFPK